MDSEKQTVLKDSTVLFIRRVRENDAEKMVDYMNRVGGESDFLTFGKDGCHFTVEQEKQFLRGLGNNPANLFLVGFVGNEMVCSANVVACGSTRTAHNCELGITVRKKYWQLGAASALLSELIRIAESETELAVIHLGVYENNTRAIRLYEKFGFETVGRHRKYFHVGDRYYDEVLMDLNLER